MTLGLWPDLTHLSVHPLDLVVRGVLIYAAILFLLRVSGKRQLGQMSSIEFVAMLLISNAVQNSMNGGDNSLVGGLILACVLIFMSWLTSVLSYRSRYLRALFEGTPTLVVHRGRVLHKNLARERITSYELRAMLRKQGVHHFEELASAILESDGALTLVKKTEDEQEPVREDIKKDLV